MNETLGKQLEEIRRRFAGDLDAATDARSVEDVRIRYFGRKGGIVPALFGELKSIPPEEKKEAGAALNALRAELQSRMDEAIATVSRPASTKRKAIDVTLPGRRPRSGHLHPITIVRREIEDVFREMGYSVAAGPEIESDWYNFEALNFEPEHPARDEQDTFYIGADRLLRTHTSNVQIRVMEAVKPPVKLVASGRVYRRDEITLRRSPMFHQIEGLLVDEGIHFGHLKGTLQHFLRRIFSAGTGVRFRPSYFPFTEPSAEVDISCVFCSGKGCGTCSQTGWMEILGCGMVHPKVLENVEIDSERYTGFAFGLGIDRVTMLKFGMPNIRVLFENDVRILSQF